MGLTLSLDRAFDPSGKDRDKWQEKRMAPYSYPGKANPKPHAVAKKRK
jgi:hypothetical protein